MAYIINYTYRPKEMAWLIKVKAINISWFNNGVLYWLLLLFTWLNSRNKNTTKSMASVKIIELVFVKVNKLLWLWNELLKSKTKSYKMTCTEGMTFVITCTYSLKEVAYIITCSYQAKTNKDETLTKFVWQIEAVDRLFSSVEIK